MSRPGRLRPGTLPGCGQAAASHPECQASQLAVTCCGTHCPPRTVSPSSSLDEVLAAMWGTAVADAVDWRERLKAQLCDGSLHYVTVAQRFTPRVLRTLQYLSATMKSSRFSAVELVPSLA